MIYALTPEQHAQQMAALNHGIRTLNHYDLPLKCEQLHEALAILKGLKPLEPNLYSVTYNGAHVNNFHHLRDYAERELKRLNDNFPDGKRQVTALYALEAK